MSYPLGVSRNSQPVTEKYLNTLYLVRNTMLKNYIKIAWRTLFKNKVFSLVNIIGLAIGLAACWFIALYVGDEFSYDRYHEKADRIVRVVQHTRWDGNDIHEAPTSPPFAPALKAAFPEIEDAVRVDLEGGGVIQVGDKKIKQDDIIIADKGLTGMFSYDFLFGDPTTALAKPQSIILTEELANKLFGSAEKAFQQTIYLGGTLPNVVTGVIKDVPQNSHLRFSGARSFDENFTAGWQNFFVYTYLLLKPGVNPQELEKKLPSFAAQTIQKLMRVKDYKIELQPLTSIHLHSDLAYEISANGSISKIYLLIAMAVLILLIAIINYVNLSTAQYTTRVKEIGVRKVIGSSKGHISAMLMTEALITTLIAAATALLIVKLGLPLFNDLANKELSVWRFGKSTTLCLLLGFSCSCGMLSGIYPAWLLARFQTIPALKGNIRTMVGSVFFRRILVGFQFTVTIVLITACTIIYKQLRYVQTADLGFNKEQVLTFHIDSREVRNQVAALKVKLMESTLIEGAAAAGNPIGNNDLGGLGYKFETPAGDFNTPSTPAQELMVDADFLPTMDIRLLQGRNFSMEMQTDRYGAALINETLMKKLGWKNPVGKRMQFPIDDRGHTAERTVIGVVKDFHTYSLQHSVGPLVMVMPPASSMEDNLYVKLAKGKTLEALRYLDQVYREFDKTAIVSYQFLNENFSRQYQAEQKQGQLTLILTLLAILIACLGLFGLSIFTAAQRTGEIGIRKVLGASVPDIVRMLSADFLKLVVFASIIACPIAWFFMNRWLQGFAYHIGIEGWVFFAAGLLAFVIALLTISFQAIKAALANPIESLRNE